MKTNALPSGVRMHIRPLSETPSPNIPRTPNDTADVLVALEARELPGEEEFAYAYFPAFCVNLESHA